MPLGGGTAEVSVQQVSQRGGSGKGHGPRTLAAALRLERAGQLVTGGSVVADTKAPVPSA
jgi:hypothetical protein